MQLHDAPSSVQVPDREVLPTNVRPTAYHVTLEPDLDKFTYDGALTIDLNVKDLSKTISLNSLDIDVHDAELTTSDFSVKPTKTSYHEGTQVTTFAFDKELVPQSTAKLHIQFSGTLNDNMAGFYRSSYKDAQGNQKYMATTQMEPTDARRALPCFDEPALKAKWNVTLIAAKHLTCLSNMDVKHEKEVAGGKKAVTFNETPLMSSYLLAMIVGEFNVVESNDFRVPVRVYAPPDQDIRRGQFSVDLGAKTLDFYEKKFDSPFPLPKMDMVAIPDFSAGAMENWGLVTYRVVDLLFDEKTSGASTKQRVAEVVQHELAHQWFGNLVTMDFWDGLWLNEGFATWMSWYSCNVFYPEWKVWQTYVTDNLQGALGLDSLRSSHPIEVPIQRADEINQIFDAISYAKGSCVIRMISKYIGEETFLEGIRRYLKKHAYGNTSTLDLWESLSDASGKDVGQVMDIWTKNVGFPVVSVTEKGDKVHVKQNRFLRTNDVKPEEDKTLYPVFLGVRSGKGVDEEATLFTREADFAKPADDFFKVNADHSGIYRTFYEGERLVKLGKAAADGKLSVEDRAGMVADAGALSASGHQPSSSTLSLLQGFSSESEFVVWDEMTSFIASVRGAWLFEDEATRDALKAFQRDLASKKAHELGWTFSDQDGLVRQQFKSLMFSSAGAAGDEKIVAAAKHMFERFAAGDRSAIDPNIRGGVYALALQYGGKKEYETIYHEFQNAKTADERNTALRSLGRAKDPELIQRTLGLALGDEVRDQDIYMPLGGLRTHREGVEALWTAMKSNWEVLVQRLPPGLSMLGSVVQLCTASFTHQDQLADIEAFFKTKSTKGFDQGLAQALDAVRAKSQWVGRDGEDVKKWLQANGYSG